MSDRIIKFRVWDIIAKRLYVWPILLDNYIGDGNVVLSQFTGWLDDNNKEIYEGDILRWDCAATLEEPAEVAIYVVQWSNENLRYELYDPFNGERLEMGNTKFDIIVGNIWENPNVISCED